MRSELPAVRLPELWLVLFFLVLLPLLVPVLLGTLHTRQVSWIRTVAIEVPAPVELVREDQDLKSPASHALNPAALMCIKQGPAVPRQAGRLSCCL